MASVGEVALGASSSGVTASKCALSHCADESGTAGAKPGRWEDCGRFFASLSSRTSPTWMLAGDCEILIIKSQTGSGVSAKGCSLIKDVGKTTAWTTFAQFCRSAAKRGGKIFQASNASICELEKTKNILIP